ncbi:hypothetical protein [Scardovia wiggsiae]|uniref:hypothetical protein n=2 Tax=Scardovia wiggsiae TaxID=230143 RepID=UPI003BADB43B
MPTWLQVLSDILIVVAVVGGLIAAVFGVRAARRSGGGGVRVANGAKKAKGVASQLSGRFLYSVGNAMSGSYAQVQDRHAAFHFVPLKDKFEEYCFRQKVWVPLGYGPFASGSNRYLLNYVEVPRPYGHIAAYEFRYDDPSVDWHLAVVYDIAVDEGQTDASVAHADRAALVDAAQEHASRYYPVTVENVEGHDIIMSIDCMPAGINAHYAALLDL